MHINNLVMKIEHTYECLIASDSMLHDRVAKILLVMVNSMQ